MGGGDNVAFFAGDAVLQSTAEGIVDFTIERFGKLDIMCLNLGVCCTPAPVAQMSDEEWRLVEMDWNLNSVFWGMRKSLQHMIHASTAGIVVTSSVEGKGGKPGIPGYNTTKHQRYAGS